MGRLLRKENQLLTGNSSNVGLGGLTREKERVIERSVEPAEDMLNRIGKTLTYHHDSMLW